MTTYTYVTPPGSTVGDGPVSASAVFTVSGNTLTITLSDLLTNPTSAGQLVSDLQFTLSSPMGTAGLTYRSLGQEITVNAGGTYTVGSTVPTGWGFGTSGTSNLLCVICPGSPALNFAVTTNPPPSHLIIAAPSGNYTNANGSITGNDPHNAFLDGSATFTITSNGITSGTVVTGAVFSFGTQPGVNVTGTTGGGGGGGGGQTPEPGTLLLMGAGLAGLGLARRRATS